tara:strand:+ start:2666 stop:4336 length:1671 start_codon:yes stop_codon:yes gene_type:complete
MPIITNFNIALNDLPASGESRQFSVHGEPGCIFSLEIINEDGYYYNFDTEIFAAAKASLKNKKISTRGIYTGSILFPSVSDDDDYDIYLWAESAWGTTHTGYKEIRYLDGSLNINASYGSNSNLIQKIIYQYTDTTITLDARSPSYLAAWASVAMTGNRTLVVPRGKNSGKIPFSVIVTTAATRALQISRQPQSSDIYAFEEITVGTGQEIPGEDIWAGTTASGAIKGTVTGGNGGSSSVNITLSTTLASAFTTYGPVGYRVTGTSTDDELNTKVITIISYTSSGPTIELSEAVAVSNGTTLTITAPQYHRWSVNSSSSMHNLRPGMRINFSTGSDVDYSWAVRPAIIQNYVDNTTYTLQNVQPDGEITKETRTTNNYFVPALDTVGYKPTMAKGIVTKQLGNITFNTPVNEDATNRAAWLYAYGEEFISAIYSSQISFSDLKVEITKPTTTTTEATSAHATIAVADREGVINNVSKVSGIGIDSSVVNPTITSGGGADGAGDWVMGAVQTLESGITLTIENTSRVATITGNIEVSALQSGNFTLYFDLETFLTVV